MPSEFDRKDEEFVNSVHSAMIQRFDINVENKEGVAQYGGNENDQIFPQLFISNEELKVQTGREKLRDGTKEKIAKAINSNSAFSAVATDNGITVEISPFKKIGITQFDSFEQLQTQNRIDENKIREKLEDDE